MAGNGTCKALTDAEYAKYYSTFKDGSVEDDNCLKMIAPFLKEYEGHTIDLMSIGAGTGSVLDKIVENCGDNLKSIFCIEPNPTHIEQLRQRALGWKNITTEIDTGYFGEKYETAKLFDVILIVHTMYCMKRPIDAIMRAKSFLKPEGKLLILVQGEKSNNSIVSRLLQDGSFPSSPNNDSFITSGPICKGLTDIEVEYEVKHSVVPHDITDFIEKRASPTKNNKISFYWKTKYEDLSIQLQDMVYQLIKDQLVSTDEKGRKVMCIDNDLIIIRN